MPKLYVILSTQTAPDIAPAHRSSIAGVFENREDALEFLSNIRKASSGTLVFMPPWSEMKEVELNKRYPQIHDLTPGSLD